MFKSFKDNADLRKQYQHNGCRVS